MGNSVMLDGASAVPLSSLGASPQKRPGDPLGVNETPAKRLRVQPDYIIEEQKMIGGEDLFRTTLMNGKALPEVSLVVKPGHRIYIVNKGATIAELTDGHIVAGFGKGKFKFKDSEPDANPATHIAFHLTNSENKIFFNNTTCTLKDVVTEKRKTDGTPKICYHTMEEVSNDEVGSFRLSQTHEVLFALLDQEVPKDGVKELLINKVGALAPTNVWKSHCLDIFWACRWTPTGLQAVRPVVCLTAGVSLPPGCALVCN